MITVILGPDRALARASLRETLAEVDPTGDNTSWFDNQSDQIGAAIAALSTRTFFSDTRVVVAQGFVQRSRQSSGGRGKLARSSASGDSSDPLESLISLGSTQGHLILFEPEMAAVPAGIKSLLPPDAKTHSHPPPRGSALIDFTRESATRFGSSIDRTSAERLLNRLYPGQWHQAASNPAFDRPPDIELLLTEIEKLALFAAPHSIDEHVIDLLTPAGSSDRMFPLLDAVVSGNQTGALRELQHVPPTDEERARLLAMIGQQLEFAAAATAPGRPGDPLAAGSALGMSNPNRMKSILRSISGSGTLQRHLLQTSLQADRRLKTGQDPGPTDAIYRIIAATGTTND